MRGRIGFLLALVPLVEALGQQLSAELLVSTPPPVVRSPDVVVGASFDGGFLLLSTDPSSPTFGPRLVRLEADAGLGGRSPLGTPLESGLTVATAAIDAACGQTVCGVLLRETTGRLALRRVTFAGAPVDAVPITIAPSASTGRLAFIADTAVVLSSASAGLTARFVTGTAVGSPIALSATSSFQLAMACLPTGSCLSAWDEPSALRARGFTSTGTLGPEFTVSTATWNPLWLAVGGTSARFMVVWRSGFSELRQRTWTGNVSSPTMDRVVRAAPSGEISQPALGWFDNRFRVVWSESGTTNRGVWTRDLDEFGVALTAERQVTTGARSLATIVGPTTIFRQESFSVPDTWRFDDLGAQPITGTSPGSSRALGGFVSTTGLGVATMGLSPGQDVGTIATTFLRGSSFVALAGSPTGSPGGGVACQGSLCLMAWPGQRDAGFALHLQRFDEAGLIDPAPQRFPAQFVDDVRPAPALAGFLLAMSGSGSLVTQPVSAGLALGPLRSFESGTAAFAPAVTGPTRAGAAMATGQVDYDPPIREIQVFVPPGGLTPAGVFDFSARFDPVRAAARGDDFLVPVNTMSGLSLEARRLDGGVTTVPVATSTALDGVAASDGIFALVSWVSADAGTRAVLARGFDLALMPLGPPFLVAAADNVFNLGAVATGQGRFLVTYDRYEAGPGVSRTRARLVSVFAAGLQFDGTACTVNTQCLNDRCVTGFCQPRSDAGSLAPLDGGVPDAGMGDGGATGVADDGGTMSGDGGVLTDGGTMSGDGGVLTDGGTMGGDGGVLVDGGTTSSDGGVLTDGGTTSGDGGVLTDGGTASSDGEGGGDGGPMTPGAAPDGGLPAGEVQRFTVGCGCGATDLTLFGAIMALLLRRPRSSVRRGAAGGLLRSKTTSCGTRRR
jgi:hypothetical protein